MRAMLKMGVVTCSLNYIRIAPAEWECPLPPGGFHTVRSGSVSPTPYKKRKGEGKKKISRETREGGNKFKKTNQNDHKYYKCMGQNDAFTPNLSEVCACMQRKRDDQNDALPMPTCPVAPPTPPMKYHVAPQLQLKCN